MLTAFGGSAVPAVPRDVGLTRLQPRVPPEPSEGQPWPGSGVPAPPAGRSDGLIFPSGPSPAADAGGGGFAVAAAPAPAFPCCCRAPAALPSAPSRCLSHPRRGWSGVTAPWQGWDGVLGGNGHPLQFGLLWACSSIHRDAFGGCLQLWGCRAALLRHPVYPVPCPTQKPPGAAVGGAGPGDVLGSPHSTLDTGEAHGSVPRDVVGIPGCLRGGCPP